MKIARPYLSPSTRGYTLMEMMLVLFIIALLIGGGAALMRNVTGHAEMIRAQSDIDSLKSALVGYKTTAMFYPTQQQGLEALVTRPTSEPVPKHYSPLLKPEALTDPWGRKYQYRYPGKHNPTEYDIYSTGPSGQDGADDNVGNW